MGLCRAARPSQPAYQSEDRIARRRAAKDHAPYAQALVEGGRDGVPSAGPLLRGVTVDPDPLRGTRLGQGVARAPRTRRTGHLYEARARCDAVGAGLARPPGNTGSGRRVVDDRLTVIDMIIS